MERRLEIKQVSKKRENVFKKIATECTLESHQTLGLAEFIIDRDDETIRMVGCFGCIKEIYDKYIKKMGVQNAQ